MCMCARTHTHIYIYLHTHTLLFFPEYPLNPKSRSPRMLVIKKGSTKELQISGFPVVGSLHSQPVRNGTGTSVYKGLVPKPVTPPAKVSLGYQWHEQRAEKKKSCCNSECAYFTPESTVLRVFCFQVLLSALHHKSEWKQLFLIFLFKLYCNWISLFLIYLF